MDPAHAPNSARKPNALKAIVWAGSICGVMDITAAFVVYGHYGAEPIPLLKGIASGLLGASAQNGGPAVAALGFLCHFVIAFSAATVFYMASRWIRFLTAHAVISGIIYGPAVYFFMQYIVLPLSAIGRNPFSLKFMVIGVVIHIFCVGLPISLAVRRFSNNV
jgi:hypothetical protein